MAAPPPFQPNLLLKEVSRSFYLTLRVLPASIRSPIGLAYLLARTTDTIADTGIVPVSQQLQALQSLRERILGTSQKRLDFHELAGAERQSCQDALLRSSSEALPHLEDQKLKNPRGLQAHPSAAERTLLERTEELLTMLMNLSPLDRELVRKVLSTITSGQELDLKRFAQAGPGRIVALLTEEELDDYIWRVAGCVGEFWTRVCQAHVFSNAPLDYGRLVSDGIRFGKGLQLVNVLRDLPADLRDGRCYFPAQVLSGRDLVPEDLLKPANELRFRPAYELFLRKAEEHLAAGWAYTTSLPWRCVRVRLACAWPNLIGVRTLGRLRKENVLEPGRRIKISRAEVRGLLVRSVVWYPWPAIWDRLFQQASHHSSV